LPSASGAFVCRAIRVHRIPPHVRDDRETPLLVRRDDSIYSCFYLAVKLISEIQKSKQGRGRLRRNAHSRSGDPARHQQIAVIVGSGLRRGDFGRHFCRHKAAGQYLSNRLIFFPENP